MRRIILDVTASATVAMTMGAMASAAEPIPPLKRTSVLDVTVAGTPPVSTVKGSSIRFAPGQPTPLHRHPVPVVGVVNSGSFVFQPEGQPPKTLHQGEAFYEPANVRILRFDNASPTEPAEITAFYLADRADRPLIEVLEH